MPTPPRPGRRASRTAIAPANRRRAGRANGDGTRRSQSRRWGSPLSISPAKGHIPVSPAAPALPFTGAARPSPSPRIDAAVGLARGFARQERPLLSNSTPGDLHSCRNEAPDNRCPGGQPWARDSRRARTHNCVSSLRETDRHVGFVTVPARGRCKPAASNRAHIHCPDHTLSPLAPILARLLQILCAEHETLPGRGPGSKTPALRQPLASVSQKNPLRGWRFASDALRS